MMAIREYFNHNALKNVASLRLLFDRSDFVRISKICLIYFFFNQTVIFGENKEKCHHAKSNAVKS